MTTARKHDLNGWYEISDNPLSKVGIFDYLGASINAPEPDKIYRVYRPESEISDEACINSFRLLPWVTDHTMLGEGELPAEKKGIEGVIGQDVWFDPDDQMLKGNIKVFSDHLARLIDSGTNELSLGYRCDYDFTQSGNHNGDHYDAVQTNLRGNHLATVEEGRMGPDVSVLDHSIITFDSRDFIMTKKSKLPKTAPKVIKAQGQDEEHEESEDQEMTLSEMSEMMKKFMPMMKEIEGLKAMMAGGEEEEQKEEVIDQEHEEDAEEEEHENMDEEEEESMDEEEEENSGHGMDKKILMKTILSIQKDIKSLKKQPVGMDSKTLMKSISSRDQLAGRLSYFTGTFDHMEKTTEEVARYGVDKLGIPHMKGAEIMALESWLHNRPKPRTVIHKTYGMDSSSSNPVNELFKRV